MQEIKWLYEIILIIYGLSLVGYFIDFIQHNRKANRIAFWLLGMVWIIQVILLSTQIFIEKTFPIQNLSDSLFFYSWILVTLSLIINRFTVHFIVFFMNIFGFFILLFHIFTSAQKDMEIVGVQLVNDILIAHITLIIISYGFFTLSFIFSIIYLIQYRFLKDKKGLKWMWRFGDLHRLDSYSFVTVTLGVPLLLIGIILGFVWGFVSNDLFYLLDLKTVGSILVLAVYSLFLLLRLVKGYKGKTIAIYNTAAFLVLLINYFLFSLLSNFHF